jgi:predicted outer membrane repeat protein
MSCSSPVCGTPCTPIVCPTCAHTTIQQAIDAASAGDVIAIAPGTYTEDLAIAKDLTLRGCPGGVVTITNTAYAVRAITVTNGASLSLVDVIVDGYSDYDTSSTGGGIATDGDLLLARKSAVRNSYWVNGGGISAVGDGLTVTVTDQAVISGNYADTNGGGVFVDGAATLVVSAYALLQDNQTDSYGGALASLRGADVTISGHVILRNNRGGGAALFVRRDTATRDIAIVVEGDVLVTGNTTINGKDGGFARFANHGDSITYRPMDVQIRDRVTFSSNTAQGDGGLISSRWGKITLSGSVSLTGNHSDSNGGAIWISPPSGATWPVNVDAVTISGAVSITGNSADAGGAIRLRGSRGIVSGTTAITNNTATGNGGGVYLSVAELVVAAGASITGNTAASGGGVYSDDAQTTLTSAPGTIHDNTPDNCAGTGISCA